MSRTITWLMVVSIAFAISPLWAQVRYTIEDLGNFTANFYSPSSLNDVGHVVGRQGNIAAVYRAGVVTQLGTLGGNSSNAYAINNRGEIVGSALTSLGVEHPFLYTGHTMIDLTPGFERGTAWDINDSGHITGYKGFTSLSVFLYANGVFRDIIQTGYTAPLAINNRDEITGIVSSTSSFIYSSGTIYYPQNLGYSSDINDFGEVIATKGSGTNYSALLYSNGVVTPLVIALSSSLTGVGINNLKQVVGTAYVGNTTRGYLYENGQGFDLHTLVDLASSNFAEILGVIAISNSGIILAYGTTKSGQLHQCLLRPILQLPPWWAARGVLDSSKTATDYAVANQGQTKAFASKAVDELEARLTGGAGAALTQLIATWSNTAGARDFAAINQGQLKTIAKLFYDRLTQVGYHGPPLQAGQVYPWSTVTTDDADFAAANIGQLKYLFSFDLGGSNTDSDNDGLPDWWERWYFGNITAQNGSGDPDGDGLTNLQEYTAGTNPTVPNS